MQYIFLYFSGQNSVHIFEKFLYLFICFFWQKQAKGCHKEIVCHIFLKLFYINWGLKSVDEQLWKDLWTEPHHILWTDPRFDPRVDPLFVPWNYFVLITVYGVSTRSFGKICEPNGSPSYFTNWPSNLTPIWPRYNPRYNPRFNPQFNPWNFIYYSLLSVDEQLWKDLWTERQPIPFYELTPIFENF